MMNDGWKQIRLLRILYFLFIFFSPILAIIVLELTESPWLALFFFVCYGSGISYFILKKLFKQKCPVCGHFFFSQPGGIIIFIRCNSCKAKIGDSDI